MPSYKAQDLKVLSQLFSPEIPCVGLIYTRCIVSSCWYVHFGHWAIKVFCSAVAFQLMGIKFDGLHWTILYCQTLPTVNLASNVFTFIKKVIHLRRRWYIQHFQDVLHGWVCNYHEEKTFQTEDTLCVIWALNYLS